MYYVSNLLLVCVSIMMNVFLESVYYNNKDKKPPALLKKVSIVSSYLSRIYLRQPFHLKGPHNEICVTLDPLGKNTA